MTDTIADMLTRIRNGIQARAKTVEMPSGKLKIQIAKILKDQGFISNYRVLDEKGTSILRIELKSPATGEPVLKSVTRGRVVLKGPYATKDDVRRVINREESLLANIPPNADLYDTLLETVNRSLGHTGDRSVPGG
jgi:small subunit ribosomal protein S8